MCGMFVKTLHRWCHVLVPTFCVTRHVPVPTYCVTCHVPVPTSGPRLCAVDPAHVGVEAPGTICVGAHRGPGVPAPAPGELHDHLPLGRGLPLAPREQSLLDILDL